MRVKSIAGIIGRVRIDNVARALGSDFGHFNSKYGIQGLCRIVGGRVDFLAVVADKPGRGAFRRMIAAMKKTAEEIGVYEVGNPLLADHLNRHGFRHELAPGVCREMVNAYVWRRACA